MGELHGNRFMGLRFLGEHHVRELFLKARGVLLERLGFRVSTNLHRGRRVKLRSRRIAFEESEQIRNRGDCSGRGLGRLQKGSLHFGSARRINEHRSNGLRGCGIHGRLRSWRNRQGGHNRDDWRGGRRCCANAQRSFGVEGRGQCGRERRNGRDGLLRKEIFRFQRGRNSSFDFGGLWGGVFHGRKWKDG